MKIEIKLKNKERCNGCPCLMENDAMGAERTFRCGDTKEALRKHIITKGIALEDTFVERTKKCMDKHGD